MIPCVVISSIGRDDRVHGLFESLINQTDPRFVVGICDQSLDKRVLKVAASYASKLDLFVTTSQRGLSNGRNAVLASAPDSCTHFLFPNDTSVFPPSVIADLHARHDKADVVAMAYADSGGPRYDFQPGNYPINHRNVWRIIEPGMVVSKRVFDLVGRFDPLLGTGSMGPWQSGEGSDLLLRMMNHGHDMRVAWDPEITVQGVDQDFGLSPQQRRRKLRSYGRGYGYLHWKWQYPFLRKIRICVTPLLRSVIPSSRRIPLGDAACSSLGRLEGAFVLHVLRDR